MDWYEIRDPQDKMLDELAAKYKLHPLHIEDCRHRNQSAKVEPQDGYLFIVLKPVHLDEQGSLSAGDLDIFIGPGFLVVVEETDCRALRPAFDRAAAESSQIRPDTTFYRIADALIDSYYPVLDRISNQIDRMEDEAIECPEPSLLEQLFAIRRSLIELRRILANSRDVFGHLLRSQYKVIGEDLQPFLRDIYDHIARSLDLVEIQRDIATGTVELYLSSVANRTNQVMKVLTIFGAIATPALVITGLYGMNLKHLPFVDHTHSWGIVIGMIAGVSLTMLLILKRLRWL